MQQTQKIYLISDAARQVQVESHVLRYWEEELKLPIKRNEMGHRYYTEEDILQFRQIRNLKEQGLQLKAIRNMLQKGKLGNGGSIYEAVSSIRGETEVQGFTEKNINEESVKRHVVMVNKGEFVPVTEESKEAKSIRLQQLLKNMIMEAVQSNNREVCEEIKETLLKELDYQFRLQEEREEEWEGIRTSRQEEHYKQLDELLRSRNKGRRQKGNVNAKSNGGQSEKDFLQGDEGEEKAEKKGFFSRKKRSIK